MNENEDIKDRLKQWQVSTPLPPRFKSQVWQRIEAARERSLWHRANTWTNQIFAAPIPRFAMAAAVVLMGVFGGVMQARNHTEEARQAGRARYVQSVDPVQLAALKP